MSIEKIVIGIVLGVLIGVGCRFFDIPLPGPPAILGAVLAVAMATGYTVTDRVLSERAAARSPTQATASATLADSSEGRP